MLEGRRCAAPLASRALVAALVTAAVAVTAAHGQNDRTGTETLLPLCRTSDYRLRLELSGLTGGAVGADLDAVGIRHRCRIGSRVRLTVERQSGSLVRGIRTNPNVTHVRVRLTASPLSAYSLASWAWRNWCRSRSKVRLVARLGSARVIARVTRPPRCDVPSSPSTLELLAPR